VRREVKKRIEERLEERHIPAFVQEFLRTHWLVFLEDVFSRYTENSIAWNAAQQTMDDLIWLTGKSPDLYDRQRQVQLLPSLLFRLVNGMKVSAMEDEDIGNADLARRLGVSEGVVRRLVDPDPAVPGRVEVPPAGRRRGRALPRDEPALADAGALAAGLAVACRSRGQTLRTGGRCPLLAILV